MFNTTLNDQRSLMALFIFLLIISGNYLGNLFPCRVQSLLDNNILLKHFLGYFTLFFFVLLTLPDRDNDVGVFSQSLIELMSGSFLVYIFFILLSKTPSFIWLIVFFMSAIIYVLELHKNDYDKNESKENFYILKTVKDVTRVQEILFKLAIVITIAGFFIYMGEKKFEYKNKFSYITFIFGKSQCKNFTHNKSLINSVKHIFA